MNELPVQPPRKETVDDEQLRLLAIFHYIVGGLILLFSCFAIFYIAFGLVMAINPELLEPPNKKGERPPEFFGYLFAAFGSCFLLIGWILGSLTIYSGRCLQHRRRRLFTLVVAGLNCAWVPVGTALGVFTFVVLFRPSVKELYGER
jgi:hypothetical protein